jgi:transcription elongation factor Elf1
MYLKICNVSLYNEIQEEKKRYCPHCNKEVTVNTLLDKKNWFINRGIFKKRV